MKRREFLRCAGCAGLAAAFGCRSTTSRDRQPVNPEDFSYCGLNCRACDVFKATVHGDHEARLRAAQQFAKTAKEHWKLATLDPNILDCRGCRVTEIQHHGYGRCPIRQCVRQRGFASCGLCPEWRQCATLRPLLEDCPEAKRNLQRVAATG
jgi:Protein of unknown function (DUF3795)